MDRSRLYQKGLELLDRRDSEGVRRVAAQLEKVGYTGGLELRGLACHQTGDLNGAIRAFREGTMQAPQLPVFWSRLGHALSDAKRFHDALHAYNRYRETGGESSYAAYNVALVRWRMGAPAEALVELEAAKGYDRIPLQHLRGLALIDLGEPDRALRECGEVDGVKVRALAELGRAEEARRLAKKMLEDDHGDEDARVALLMLGQPGPAKRFQLLVEGQSPGGPIRNAADFRFAHWYVVDADSQEEAFELMQAFEPRATGLTLSEANVLSQLPGPTKGVVHCTSGYSMSPIHRSWLRRVLPWLPPRIEVRGDARIVRKTRGPDS